MKLIVKDIIRMGENQLKAAEIEGARVDSEIIFRHIMHMTRSEFFMNWGTEVDERTSERFFDLIDRRAAHEPLQYITGEQEFAGLKFKVNERVLIPRQDTEVLVREVIKIIKPERGRLSKDKSVLDGKYKRRGKWDVLDMCCGTGVIGISVASFCDNAKVTAVDLSHDAIETAKKNADFLNAKVNFRIGDMFEPVRRHKFNMIVSNPPYIPSGVIPTLQPEVKDHEPLSALDGGADGLDFYRRIIHETPEHMKKGGVLALEIGHDQAVAIWQLLKDDGRYRDCEVVKDLAGLDRVVLTTLGK